MYVFQRFQINLSLIGNFFICSNSLQFTVLTQCILSPLKPNTVDPTKWINIFIMADLYIFIKRNWVFATNFNFLNFIYFQPNILENNNYGSYPNCVIFDYWIHVYIANIYLTIEFTLGFNSQHSERRRYI